MKKSQNDMNKSKADGEKKKKSKEPPENITNNNINITINTSGPGRKQSNAKQVKGSESNTDTLSISMDKLQLDGEKSSKVKSIGTKSGKKSEQQNEEQIKLDKNVKTEKEEKSNKNNQESNIKELDKQKEDKGQTSTAPTKTESERRCMENDRIQFEIDEIANKITSSSKVQMEFITSEPGYHMRLVAYFTGKNKNSDCLAIYFQIIEGDFDESLDWPFTSDVTFKLINQQTEKVFGELVKTKKYDKIKKPKAYEKPIKKKEEINENNEIGFQKFVKLDVLQRLALNDKIIIEFSLDHVVTL